MVKKILIVEDDQWFADTISSVIKKNNYKPKISPHIVAAINDVDKFKPQIIIMDLLLVGSTAFNLMHELQSHSDLSKIPIIVCTNLGEQLNLKDLKPYGVYELLDKTKMQPEDIVLAIKRIEGGKSGKK